MQKRTAFFISDSTGITAESVGHTLLTQFEFMPVAQHSLRFIKTPADAQKARRKIDRAAEQDGIPPLVFSTLINPDVRAEVKAAQCAFFDLFDMFIEPMERELGVKSVPTEGHSHGLTDWENYLARMEAVNFTVNHDDGAAVTNLEQAHIILMGISRTGKTPTCLYMSLHHGVKAANFPLTEEELEELRLPKSLQNYRKQLFGLTTDPARLQAIREERLPNTRYASLAQCEFEVRQSEALFRKLDIPYLATTMMSIEEITATIVDQAGLEAIIYPPLAVLAP